MAFRVVVKKNEQITIYESAREAARKLGVSAMTMSKALRGERTMLYNNGYTVYKYEDYYRLVPQRTHNTDNTNKKYSGKGKKINKLDRFTNAILDTYDSISEACNDLGVPGIGLVSLCCKGKRDTAYGYKWEYVVEESIENGESNCSIK